MLATYGLVSEQLAKYLWLVRDQLATFGLVREQLDTCRLVRE
jgi:hypothetical protein